MNFRHILSTQQFLNKKLLDKFNQRAVIMHPLPRVSEISREVDDDKRAAYFRQARNGLYIRMALLSTKCIH